MGRRVDRKSPRQKRRSGGTSSSAIDKVRLLISWLLRISSSHVSGFSRSQMPPTEKGLVGSIAGKERVFESRESKITRGSRQHSRGASSTYCWGSIDACWCRCQCTTQRTPSQHERQFTGAGKCKGRCWCAWVRL